MSTYPIEVYCTVVACTNIAWAQCAEDDPTCVAHGDKHTCGDDTSTIMSAARRRRVEAFGNRES